MLPFSSHCSNQSDESALYHTLQNDDYLWLGIFYKVQSWHTAHLYVK